jgi:hypothetical protein
MSVGLVTLLDCLRVRFKTELSFFCGIPFYLQAVHVHLANGVK